MIKFDVELAKKLQELIIKESGGSSGIRDENLLDSALNSCYPTFGGQELYSTIQEKGARLGYNLICNHAFIDGNKRIGILIMITFLQVNGVILDCNDEDIVNIGFGVASGRNSYLDLLNWIKNHEKIK